MSRYYIYDSVTDTFAEFAKKKDNRRRNAMIGAGAVGGVGVLGAGYRYGKSALRGYRKGSTAYGTVGERMGNAGRSAKRRLMADVEQVKRAPGRAYNAVKNYDYAGAPGRAKDAIASGYGRASDAVKGGYGLAKDAAMGVHGLKGRAALAGAALGTAGLIGGGAYLGARALNKRKRDRNSVRGRVRALLGR